MGEELGKNNVESGHYYSILKDSEAITLTNIVE